MIGTNPNVPVETLESQFSGKWCRIAMRREQYAQHSVETRDWMNLYSLRCTFFGQQLIVCSARESCFSDSAGSQSNSVTLSERSKSSLYIEKNEFAWPVKRLTCEKAELSIDSQERAFTLVRLGFASASPWAADVRSGDNWVATKDFSSESQPPMVPFIGILHMIGEQICTFRTKCVHA
jgi:hypothetical protein